MSTAVANNVVSVIAYRGFSAHGVSSAAMDVRREWMHMMGFSDLEIAEECRLDPPTDQYEELGHYNAMFAIQERNSRA